MTDKAPQTGRLFTLAEAAKLCHIPAQQLLQACRAGAIPGAVLVERRGKMVYAFTPEAVVWLEIYSGTQEAKGRRGRSRTCGMWNIGGSYHAMCGFLGRDGRRVRRGS